MAATLSAGIVLTSAQHKYVARSPGLPRKVVCDAGGSCPKDKLKRAVASYLRREVSERRLDFWPWHQREGIRGLSNVDLFMQHGCGPGAYTKNAPCSGKKCYGADAEMLRLMNS